MSDLPKLGLCMIVKDESHVIERCLESVSKHIDTWLICDTGSTDGTQDIIREFFKKKGIPGEVVEIPWEGFGKSRTKAFQLAKERMKYAFVIDADDTLEGNPAWPNTMTADAYTCAIKRGEFLWYRNQIFKTECDWRYEGVLHEYASCDKLSTNEAVTIKLGGDYHVEARTEGGRNLDITPQEKYLKDAEILTDALTNEKSPYFEPENTRYAFYLAQSYFDAGEYELSREWYLKRAQCAGWEEEVYYSMFRVGIINAILERPMHEIVEAFLQCWSYRPNRAEPLFQIARLYRNNGNPRLGYLYAKQGLNIPYPENDILFISHEVYQWQLLDEIAASAFYLHHFEEGMAASKMLLNMPEFPKEHHQRTRDNIKHYENAIVERNENMKSIEQRAKELKEAEESSPTPKPKSFKNRKGKKRKGPTQSKKKHKKSEGFDKSMLR